MTVPVASLVEQRAEVARLKTRLADLDEFEALWDRYADLLREIVGQMGGRGAEQIPSGVRKKLAAAEPTRVEVIGIGRVKFDDRNGLPVEITRLTDANLRTHPDHFFVNVTEHMYTSEYGAVGGRQVVTVNALEGRLGEAKGRIARKRESMKADLRAKELLVAEHVRGTVTLRALGEKWLAHVPGKGLRKFLSSALLDHTKSVVGPLLLGLLLAGVHFCAPGVEQKVKDAWQRATVDSTRTNP